MVYAYNGAWDWLVDAANMAFSQAGDVEEFTDADGMLCLRLPVMRTNNVVHETPMEYEAIPVEKVARRRRVVFVNKIPMFLIRRSRSKAYLRPVSAGPGPSTCSVLQDVCENEDGSPAFFVDP